MIISIIVAMDEQNGIGYQGKIPWHLPADLKRFKEITLGHCLIMGRKTYESIGKPLPGRQMIIITRQADYKPARTGLPRDPGGQAGQSEKSILLPWVAGSLEQALKMAEETGETEVFITGGGEIYTQALRIANKIYLTRVHTVVEADTFFPAINPAEWQLISSNTHPSDEKNYFRMTYQELRRV